MSTIYVIEENIDYGDANSSCDLLVSDDKYAIEEVLFNIVCDDDFTRNSYKDKYSYRLIEWNRRVSKVLLSFDISGKEHAIHFIETFQ